MRPDHTSAFSKARIVLVRANISVRTAPSCAFAEHSEPRSTQDQRHAISYP